MRDGDPNFVTDSGHTWHWTGTGNMGEDAHVTVFGHRTEAGAPYRRIDTMVPGDLFTVTTGDAREYTYRVLACNVIGCSARCTTPSGVVTSTSCST